VLATQNPVDLSGTYPLPDSQLDRFLLRLSMGYPDAAAERAMLAGEDRRQMISHTQAVFGTNDVLQLRQRVGAIHTSATLIAYVQRLLAESRRHPGIQAGLSPRAGLALLQVSRAIALLRGRAHVLPDDVQYVFPAVASHRLVTQADTEDRDTLALKILSVVAVD